MVSAAAHRLLASRASGRSFLARGGRTGLDGGECGGPRGERGPRGEHVAGEHSPRRRTRPVGRTRRGRRVSRGRTKAAAEPGRRRRRATRPGAAEDASERTPRCVSACPQAATPPRAASGAAGRPDAPGDAEGVDLEEDLPGTRARAFRWTRRVDRRDDAASRNIVESVQASATGWLARPSLADLKVEVGTASCDPPRRVRHAIRRWARRCTPVRRLRSRPCPSGPEIGVP